MLPYLDVPLVRGVFENCEKARTIDAAASGLPGLLASVNDVTNGSIDIPDYDGATGIPALAFEPVPRRDVVTPYGAWALMLHNVTAGLCWYGNMLSAPRMQSTYGSTEAVAVNGTMISPLTTWDSKITTVLALLGGVVDLVRQGLRGIPDAPHFTPVQRMAAAAAGGGVGHGPGHSAYDRFAEVIYREHQRVFGDDVSTSIPFALPTTPVPSILSDWDTCP